MGFTWTNIAVKGEKIEKDLVQEIKDNVDITEEAVVCSSNLSGHCASQFSNENSFDDTSANSTNYPTDDGSLYIGACGANQTGDNFAVQSGLNSSEHTTEKSVRNDSNNVLNRIALDATQFFNWCPSFGS